MLQLTIGDNRMPKRKKEEKPKKRISRKQILPSYCNRRCHFSRDAYNATYSAPPVLGVCLKAHNVDTFNVHPTIEIVVDRQPKLLPDDVGKEPKDGKECVRVIHTDELGNKVHIQYVRPIRLTMGDFLKLYSTDNKTITVFGDITRVPTEQLITRRL
jgi:hypothetical protein